MLTMLVSAFEGSTKAEIIGDAVGVICLFVLVFGLSWGLPFVAEVFGHVIP